ncbi:ankyrin repeat-containing domain protein [Aspergillus spectabilis]
MTIISHSHTFFYSDSIFETENILPDSLLETSELPSSQPSLYEANPNLPPPPPLLLCAPKDLVRIGPPFEQVWVSYNAHPDMEDSRKQFVEWWLTTGYGKRWEGQSNMLWDSKKKAAAWQRVAKVDETTNSNGSSLVHLAVAAQDREILQLLLDTGAAAHMTTVDAFGPTPIHLAAIADDVRIPHILSDLSVQLDINLGDIDGCTALHRAVENNAVSVAEWLLARGARTSIEDYNATTPFQTAARMKNFEMMALLFPHTTGGLVKASELRHLCLEVRVNISNTVLGLKGTICVVLNPF